MAFTQQLVLRPFRSVGNLGMGNLGAPLQQIWLKRGGITIIFVKKMGRAAIATMLKLHVNDVTNLGSVFLLNNLP